MRNFDFAPLSRSTIGFDCVFDLLDSAFSASQSDVSRVDIATGPRSHLAGKALRGVAHESGQHTDAG